MERHMTLPADSRDSGFPDPATFVPFVDSDGDDTMTQGGYVTIFGPSGTVHTFPDRRQTNRQRRLEDRERNIQQMADRAAQRKDEILRTKIAAVLGYITGIATTLALLYLTS